MPDRPPKLPGSLTEAADREHRDRISGISNVSKTVNAMRDKAQRDMKDLDMEIKQNKDVQAIESSMNRVLKKLGDTIGSLNKGVQQITIGTAKATKDAIAQYGKALNEDIGFQKQNFIAMTLAKTTPLFGYFAAKFMETDVFKNATARMRESIGNALSGAWSGTKRAARRITGRAEPAEVDLAKTTAREIPKMQHGGYVEKGGMVRVHAGEVVAPIEKVLQRVDESISTAKDLATIAKKTQLSMISDMHTFVKSETKKVPGGIVRGFINAYAKVQSRYQEPTDKRMLRALLSIQEAIGAQPETMSQVWAEFIATSPWFRNMLFMGKIMGKAFGTAFFKPVKFLFRTRGGYEGDLSEDENPLRAMSSNIGALYVGTMWRLDNIAAFTRRTAETTTDMASFFTGRKYKKVEGVEEPGWTIMSLLGKGFGKLFKFGIFRPMEGLLGGLVMMAAASEGKEAQGRMLLMKYTSLKGAIASWFKRRKESGKLHGGFLTHGMRAGMIEDVYGRGTEPLGAGGGAGRKAIRLMPKLIENQAEYYKPGKKVMQMLESRIPVEQKQSRKMITMTAGVHKELQDHNKREKRKLALKWLGGMISPIWSAIKGVGSFVLDTISNFISSPAVLALIGAGLLGAGIGTAINKYAIEPLIDYAWSKFFGKRGLEKKSAELGIREGQARHFAIKKKVEAGLPISAADMAYYQGYQKTVETGGVGIPSVEKKLIKQWGGKRGTIVSEFMQVARQQYAPLYSLYSPDEISRLREEWVKKKFSVSKYWQIKDPQVYAATVEKDFADYLKKEGTEQKYMFTPETDIGAIDRAKIQTVGEVQHAARVAGAAVTAGRTKVNAEVQQAIMFWDRYTGGKVLAAYGSTEDAFSEIYSKHRAQIEPWMPIAKAYLGKGKAMAKEVRDKINTGVMSVTPAMAEAFAAGQVQWETAKRLHKQGELLEATKTGVANAATSIQNFATTQVSNVSGAAAEKGGEWLKTAADYWDGFIMSGSVR